MAANRLAQILEREYQSQGLIGGIGSAIGKRTREKLDIRNALFSGSSLGGVVARKIFGKGYSATSGSSTKSDSLSSNVATTLGQQSEELKSITNATKITAKNTLALPSMARDMYLVKQNIIKLVKLNKGTPQTKSGDWMSRQIARESSFEKGFKFSSKSPTKTTETSSPSSSGGMFGFLGSMFESFGGAKLLGIVAGVGALATALIGLKDTVNLLKDMFIKLVNWVADTEIGKALGIKPMAGGTSGPGKGIKDTLKEAYADTLATASGTGAVVAGGVAARGAVNLARATTSASTAILDARTMSIGQLEKATPKTVWGKFLQFVYKKSPLLFQKIGLKLAQAGALAAIPVVGWVGAAIQLGFGIWTAWELYELWKEFNQISEEKNSPKPVEKSESQKAFDEHQTKIQEIKKKLETENRPIAKANLESELKYHQRKSDEASAAMKTSGNSPTSGTGSDYASMVGGAESGGSYNAVYGNTNATLNGKALSENTIGEVYEWQKKHMAQKTNKQAAGKYQFMDVMNAAKLAGISYREKFSPENQDKMMAAYTQKNAETLKGLGIEPTKENLSLAHAVGASGAAKLLNAQKSGQGTVVAADVLGLKQGSQRSTNPHLNKSTSQVIADAASRVNGTPPSGSPSGAPAVNVDGTALASATSNAFDPFAEMLGMMGNMLNTYHQQTVAKAEGKNFDGGSLETYNEEFLKKLLDSQGFSPNKA